MRETGPQAMRLRDVIAETYWQDSYAQLPRPNPSLAPARANAPQLRYLFVNPLTEDATITYDPACRRGWRGPYLSNPPVRYLLTPEAGFTNLYGENGDPVLPDGWGRPLVLQYAGLLPGSRLDVRLVSAGPDGVLTLPPGKPTALLTAADLGDDVWLSFEVRQP